MAEKTTLITGTSTGIGRACARWLDEQGFRVFASVRNEEDAAALRATSSDRLTTLLLDVTDVASIRVAAERVADAVGPAGLDGLVNNAGVVVSGPLEFVPLEKLRHQFEVNVTGQVAVTQAFLPLLRQARGRIVNIGSIGGRSVLPFAGAYCASKYALEALTDALRMELKAAGIEVVIIEPGGIATPIWEKGADAEVPEGAAEAYGPALDVMRGAVRRMATEGMPPEAVARVVHNALTVRRPKTRYLVGRMAYVRLLLQKLPDRLRDAILLRRFTGG